MSKVILIGGGTSVKEGISKGLWDKIKGQDIWSLNYAFKTMPYAPNREIWVDTTFFKNNMRELEALIPKNVQLITKSNDRYNALIDIKQYNATREKFEGKDMLEHNNLYYGTLGLTGFFALSLAVAEAHNEIYLLGYDFGSKSLNDLNTHYYQDDKIDYISNGVRNPRVYMGENGAKKEVKDFEHYTTVPNVKIYNVGSFSNINCFERIDYDSFFNKLI